MKGVVGKRCNGRGKKKGKNLENRVGKYWKKETQGERMAEEGRKGKGGRKSGETPGMDGWMKRRIFPPVPFPLISSFVPSLFFPFYPLFPSSSSPLFLPFLHLFILCSLCFLFFSPFLIPLSPCLPVFFFFFSPLVPDNLVSKLESRV